MNFYLIIQTSVEFCKLGKSGRIGVGCGQHSLRPSYELRENSVPGVGGDVREGDEDGLAVGAREVLRPLVPTVARPRHLLLLKGTKGSIQWRILSVDSSRFHFALHSANNLRVIG